MCASLHAIADSSKIGAAFSDRFLDTSPIHGGYAYSRTPTVRGDRGEKARSYGHPYGLVSGLGYRERAWSKDIS